MASNSVRFTTVLARCIKNANGVRSRGSLQHARSFCQEFFSWYNTEHHHSGLGLLTPEVVHSHRAEQVRDLRQHTLDIAYAAHPERFVRKPPQPPALPTAVWINPPPKPESGPPDSEETVQ